MYSTHVESIIYYSRLKTYAFFHFIKNLSFIPTPGDDLKWKRGTDKRVAGWQTFQQNINAKRFKAESWGKVGQVGAGDRHHKKEQKTEQQIALEQNNFKEGAQKRKAAGMDDQWKSGWR